MLQYQNKKTDINSIQLNDSLFFFKFYPFSWVWNNKIFLKNGTSLVGLGLLPSTAQVMGSIPGQRTKNLNAIVWPAPPQKKSTEHSTKESPSQGTSNRGILRSFSLCSRGWVQAVHFLASAPHTRLLIQRKLSKWKTLRRTCWLADCVCVWICTVVCAVYASWSITESSYLALVSVPVLTNLLLAPGPLYECLLFSLPETLFSKYSREWLFLYFRSQLRCSFSEERFLPIQPHSAVPCGPWGSLSLPVLVIPRRS